MVIGNWQIARLWDGDLYILKPRDDLTKRKPPEDDFGFERNVVYGPPVVVSLNDVDVTSADNQAHLDDIYRAARKKVHQRNKDRFDRSIREAEEL